MLPTVPYTPQQNGVSERMNRTLMDKVRSMMHTGNIPMYLWGEALYTSSFLTNRSVTSALANPITPYEMWFGKKPDVSYIRVFGCAAYAHINKHERSKLDGKSIPLTMVGYALMGYRLWDDDERKIVVSRDVIFDESTFPFRCFNPNTPREARKDFCVVDIPIPEPANPIDLLEVPENVDDSDDEEEFVEAEGDGNEIDPGHVGDVEPLSQRHSQRVTHRPNWLRDYETSFILSHYSGEVPQMIDELKKRNDWYQWKRAMEEEMQALHENKTWTVVKEIPKGRKPINSMWTFTIKMEDDVPRYKARLVAKGCSQRPGLDYSETFAPVAKMTTIRTLLSIAVQEQLFVHQMDVKTAFLNGLLEEEIYMRLPFGDSPPRICKLNKSLYGLKQAGRSWNLRFNDIIKELGFKNTESDTCLYICKDRGLYIILYVDDILIFGQDIQNIQWIRWPR